MADTKTYHKTIPFSGKFTTNDPATIGENFQTLTNLRYTDTHVKGVQGMTKINTAALTTYLKTRNAFHFKKSQPAESHVLIQAYNTGLTASQILQNTTAIPSAGAFSGTALWTDSAGAGTGYFSEAPDGQVVYCNGVDTCLWGGSERNCAAFITSTAAIADGGVATNPKDYTDIINNTKTDSLNTVLIGSSASSYPAAQSDTYVKATTKLSTSYWPYFATDPTKLLTGSDVANTWVSVNGTVTNQRFHIDLGAATVIKRIYYENFRTAAGNTTLGVKTFVFQGSNTGAGTFDDLVYANDGGWTTLVCSQNTFDQHAAGDVADPKYITVTNTTAYRYYAFKFADNWGDATNMGVRRIELKTSESNDSTFCLGSPRPLQGGKIYVQTANLTASTLTGKEWDGTAWTSLTITDNTDTGASLAVTGTVTFASTVATSKPQYLEGNFLYWYQFTLSAGEARIYRVTLNAPFQPIVDLWDGVYREVAAFYKYTTVYLDNSINVLADDYNVDTPSTYCDLSSMAAFSTPNNCMEIGFAEKQSALRFMFAPDYVNTTAATTATIDYWTGETYTSVGTITDGTSEGAISFSKNGVISWNNNSLVNETKKSVSNSLPLYFYRVRFDKAMDASVRLNYVGGVTAQKTMSFYKFPVFAQGRVLLCADMSKEKNKATVSAKYMPHVYNGEDSVDVYFGEEGELTCGTELFSQFGSSMYSLVLMFKDTETWIMAGTDINQWADNTFLLSSSIGCPAPLTLKTINLSVEPGAGINRNLAIWQGTNGVYMSDGRAPIPIHGDIDAYFNPTDTRCIKASKIGDSVGFIDPINNEYHLLIASGTAATTLNTELVYDIHRNKWFEIDRTVDLQCGVLVRDTDGNSYNYGFLDTGYMERLSYGTDFDGNDIVHTVQTGDFSLADLAYETQLRKVKLITKAKTTTSNSVSCTHYADSCTTGATAKTMSPARSGYRLAIPEFSHRLNAYPFHSLKYTMTTNNETIGFEPLASVLTFNVIRED